MEALLFKCTIMSVMCLLLIFVLVLSTIIDFSNPSMASSGQSSWSMRIPDIDPNSDNGAEVGSVKNVLSQRRLLYAWPGSSPPRCAFKCGNCRPCKPVHIPVPPVTSVTTEYYPEAWMCKCGDRLYKP